MNDAPIPKPRRRHGIASVVSSGCVLAVTIGFALYAASVTGRDRAPGYALNATFLSSNGLAAGADVLLAGVAVGEVGAISLDRATMLSKVRFTLDDRIHLPTDTRLSIGSASLTSANALMIMPGTATTMLRPGATIGNTCAASSLEQQVSQYIFGNGGAPSGC